MTHLILQTGQVQFFNQIAADSVKFVELLSKYLKHDDTIVFVAINKDIADAYNYVVKSLTTELCHDIVCKVQLLDLSDAYDMPTMRLTTKLCTYFNQLGDIHTLTIVNGACVEDQNQEVAYYAHWLGIDLSKSINDYALNRYEAGMFICFYIIEIIAELQTTVLQINNINEDPLQCSLKPIIKYITSARTKYKDVGSYKHVPVVKQMFFHEHANYEFCPLQEYPYLYNVKVYDYSQQPGFKTHKFMFSMTNVWQHKQERTKIIDMLQYMHTSSFGPYTEYVFQYSCKHITRQDLIDSSDNLMSYDDYSMELARSLYTLIIPAYDTTTFSLRRFVEALLQDCVPLIYDKCNIEWMPAEFKQLLVDNNLIVHDLAKLKQHIETIEHDWSMQLYNIKHSAFIEQYRSNEIYENCFKACKFI